jgi:hypothetical protein
MSDKDLNTLQTEALKACMADTTSMKWYCIMLLAHSGCRPIEAAYVIHNGTVEISTWKRHGYKYMATSPDTITKTGKTYKWLLPSEFDSIWEVIYKRPFLERCTW